jgi:hypothetical protein
MFYIATLIDVSSMLNNLFAEKNAFSLFIFEEYKKSTNIFSRAKPFTPAAERCL